MPCFHPPTEKSSSGAEFRIGAPRALSPAEHAGDAGEELRRTERHTGERTMTQIKSTLTAALVMALAACGGDATGTSNGSGDAQMQVMARGDDAAPSQSVSAQDG